MAIRAYAALFFLASGATAWSTENSETLSGISEDTLMASITEEDCFEDCAQDSSAVYLLRKNVKGRKGSSITTDKSEQAADAVQQAAAGKTTAETKDTASDAKSAEATSKDQATETINKAELDSIMAESDAAPNLLQTQAEVHPHVQEQKQDL
eukprot:TRINITY_DN9193_c0_g2_i1.p1 TRINITY_DN9193_c0_g2~~TRINITY_DN9193_c0_g2_i1.p1  ORF type:complete len:153 (-),score=42.64 TRINITY_DN9193_c0_g2_i1:92-550(-)